MSPKVSIIILNWNGLNDTIECLESLKKITYPNYEVIVVDNDSEGDDADVLEEKYGDYIKLIRNKENLGFTGGCNVAIREVMKEGKSDYIFLLNNDTTVEKDCLAHLVSVADKTKAGIVGAKIQDMDICEKHSVLSEMGNKMVGWALYPIHRLPSPCVEDDFIETTWVKGAAMLIWKDALRAIYNTSKRYLDEGLFFGCDEHDFCWLVRKAGYKVIIAKKVIVCHKAGRSASRGGPMAYYYITRNFILLANRLLPLHWKIFAHLVNWFLSAGRIARSILRRRPASVRAIFFGLVDGYRGITGKWKYQDQAILKRKKQK